MIKKITKIIAEKYKKFFDNLVIDLDHADYPQQLDYDASKVFYIVILGLCAMLFYIQQDWIIHQYPIFASALRIGFCLVSTVIIILKVFGPFKNKPSGLLMVIMIYHCFMIAFIAGTAGDSASPYISGFAFVMMIFVIAPIILKIKIIIYTTSIAVFFITGILTGIDFTRTDIRYSLNDFMAAFMLCIIFSYTINQMRLNSWTQQKQLHNAVKLNEVNIARIQKLAIEAENANKAKSTFLANMSHEIRTPINAILGTVEIQLQGESAEEERKEALERIYNSGNLLLSIINDLLDLSKIEAGRIELVSVTYDIPSLINDVVQLNSLQYEHKDLDFSIDIDAHTPINLYGDELRLKQILNNILNNAFKYTDKGEIKMSVYSKSSSDSDPDDVTLVFAISDTGQGMDSDQVERLFDEYSRFNVEANRATQGTGLGMSITKHFVKLMDGEISVSSEVGVGSTFIVNIPQKRVDSLECGCDISDKLRDNTAYSKYLSKKSNIQREYMPYGSVLVVDDVKSNLYVAKGLLSAYGLCIDTAADGYTAIDKIKRGVEYDIIFMDHMMPRMDGIEATRKLREMGYTRPVVALTANALVGHAEMFLENGFDAYIPKPIDTRELNTILNDLIRDKKPPEAVEAARREKQEQGSGVAES